MWGNSDVAPRVSLMLNLGDFDVHPVGIVLCVWADSDAYPWCGRISLSSKQTGLGHHISDASQRRTLLRRGRAMDPVTPPNHPAPLRGGAMGS